MKIIALLLALFSVPAFAARPSLRQTIRHGNSVQFAERTNDALNVMIALAAWDLRIHDYDEVADRMEHDWDTKWDGYLVQRVGLDDIGDHDPLSQWLADQYALLSLLLGGDEVLKFLHLDDLLIMNFAIPVVFHLARITEPIDATEYSKHFVPLSGVTGYWTAVASCYAASLGLGYISMLCTPIGMVAENTLIRYIAPFYSNRFYSYFYGTSAVTTRR